jgi:hypothetical protein
MNGFGGRPRSPNSRKENLPIFASSLPAKTGKVKPPATTCSPVRELRDCNRAIRHSMNKEARPSEKGAMPMKSCRTKLLYEDPFDASVDGNYFSETTLFTGFPVPQGVDEVQTNHRERS